MTYTWPFRLGGSVLLCTSRVNGSNYRYDELVVIRDLIYWVMILFFLLSFSFRACQLEKKKYFAKNFFSHIILSKWQVARATQPFRNTIRIEQRLHSSWWSTLTPIWSSPEDLACSLYWECGVCEGASMCCHWFGHRVDKWPKKRKRPNTQKKGTSKQSTSSTFFSVDGKHVDRRRLDSFLMKSLLSHVAAFGSALPCVSTATTSFIESNESSSAMNTHINLKTGCCWRRRPRHFSSAICILVAVLMLIASRKLFYQEMTSLRKHLFTIVDYSSFGRIFISYTYFPFDGFFFLSSLFLI